MNPLFDFMAKAKELTKNPLGIIALFISLIYGFACLVLSTSLKNLQGQVERLPLIWFIIIFPALILIGFIFLVVQHHEKLYAPSDYKDEANFIRTLDAKNQTQRIQNEVEAITQDIQEMPEIANTKKQIETSQHNEPFDKITIQTKYLIAEDLALRAFEQDKKLTLKRQSKIVSPSNKVLEFDATAFDNKNLYGVDVKFTVHRHLSKTLRDRIADDVMYYSKVDDLHFGNDFKFVLIIVADSDNHLSLDKELKDFLDKSEFKFEYLIYSFSDLKRRFGLE